MSGSQLFEYDCSCCINYVNCGSINRSCFACASFQSVCSSCSDANCVLRWRFE